MMADYDLRKFKSGLSDLNLTINDEQINKFLKYYELLIDWNDKINLTAITEFDDVINKHFLDSLSVCKYVQMQNVRSAADIGTGAGFPGIPLAIVYPEIQFTLADSLMKRMKFLEEVVKELGLQNVNLVHGRAEDLGRDSKYRERFDLVLSRAVATLPVLLEYCIPFVKEGGIFVAYKSAKARSELEQSNRALKILRTDIVEVQDFTLSNSEDRRTLIILQKKEATPRKYPRKAGTPSRKPL